MLPAPIRVLGVLAGNDLPTGLLQLWASSADLVYAADAGADALLAAGRVPHHVVGDFDSISDSALQRVPKATMSADQESSDCDKLLAALASDGHRSVVLANVEGDRPDHLLSTLASVARSPLDVGIALRRGLGKVLKMGVSFSAELEEGQLLSLIPLAETSGVVMNGVRWTPRTELSALGFNSLSNTATGGPIHISVATGAAFLFIEYPADSNPIWSSIGL